MTEIQLLGSSSLKVDYAITDKTYKVFERLQKKTEQIRDAMQDLERQCELVSLRVTRTASKILNKKSEKAVKQIAGNDNKFGSEHLQMNQKTIFENDVFLDMFKATVMDSQQNKSVMVLQEQLENDSTVNFNIVRFENWSNGMSPQIADDSNQVDCASGDKKIDEKEEEEENASIENISESSHEICNLVNDEDEEEQKIEDITPKILEDCSSSTNSSDVIPAKEESPPITNVLDKLPDNMKANLESIQRAQVSKVVDSKENTNKNKNGQIQKLSEKPSIPDEKPIHQNKKPVKKSIFSSDSESETESNFTAAKQQSKLPKNLAHDISTVDNHVAHSNNTLDKKKDAAKPIKKSLFSDSDSETDLFTVGSNLSGRATNNATNEIKKSPNFSSTNISEEQSDPNTNEILKNRSRGPQRRLPSRLRQSTLK